MGQTAGVAVFAGRLEQRGISMGVCVLHLDPGSEADRVPCLAGRSGNTDRGVHYQIGTKPAAQVRITLQAIAPP